MLAPSGRDGEGKVSKVKKDDGLSRRAGAAARPEEIWRFVLPDLLRADAQDRAGWAGRRRREEILQSFSRLVLCNCCNGQQLRNKRSKQADRLTKPPLGYCIVAFRAPNWPCPGALGSQLEEGKKASCASLLMLCCPLWCYMSRLRASLSAKWCQTGPYDSPRFF